jgi:PKD repeat protein
MSPPVQVTGTGHDTTWPGVAYDPTHDYYLVVWKGDQRIWGRIVDARGEVRGAPFEIGSSTAQGGRPRAAYDSQRNRYLVIWGRKDSQGYQMYGRFVPWDSPNPVLTAFAIDATKPAQTDVYALAYGSDADEFLVVWVAESSGTTWQAVAGRRVKGGGGFAAGTFVIAEGSGENRGNPDVAYNATRNEYLVTYDDYPKTNENIYAKRLSATGTPMAGGEFLIAAWPGDEIDPAVAACPGTDQYLVAWHGIPMPGDGIWARYVSGLGNLGSVVPLEDFLWWSYALPLDVACGVTELEQEDPGYLVAWGSSYDLDGTIYARLVETDGSQSDEMEISRETGAVATAGGAINHLVAWETSDPDRDNYADIYARIVGNTKPKAWFTVTPEEGDCWTNFAFDASPSSDNTDPPEQLAVRWQWDDSAYTNWTHDRTATHQFALDPGRGWDLIAVHLEVSDGTGPETVDRTFRFVRLHNIAPQADFTVTPTSGSTGTNFYFDASASSDPEGGSLEVRWDWDTDGEYDTGWSGAETASHIFPTAGTHSVRLEVRDAAQKTDVRVHEVRVTEGNGAPTASFTVTPTSGDTETTFHFNASGSTDPDGSPLEVRWDWEDDGTFDTPWITTKTADHNFATAGAYTVRLEVRNAAALTSTAVRQVRVTDGSGGPTASFTVTPTSGDTGTSFRFDASGSTNPDGGPLEVRWDWEDDGTHDTLWTTTKTASHVFPAAGTYTVRLEIRNAAGQTATAARQVQVGGGAQQRTYLPLVVR